MLLVFDSDDKGIVHPHVNLRLPRLLYRRAHHHPGQYADTTLTAYQTHANIDCAINSGGGKDGVELRNEERGRQVTLGAPWESWAPTISRRFRNT